MGNLKKFFSMELVDMVLIVFAIIIMMGGTVYLIFP